MNKMKKLVKSIEDCWTKNGYKVMTIILIPVVTLFFIAFIIGGEADYVEKNSMLIITTFIAVIALSYKLLNAMEVKSYMRIQRDVKVIIGEDVKDFETKFSEGIQSLIYNKSSIIEVKEVKEFMVYIYFFPKK